MADTAPVSDLAPQIAEEVRVWLARRRLSATELARRLGVTQSYLARRMVGAHPFDVVDLERIAQALDVSVVDLFPAAYRSTSERATGRYSTTDPLAARVVAVGGQARPTHAVRTRPITSRQHPQTGRTASRPARPAGRVKPRVAI